MIRPQDNQVRYLVGRDLVKNIGTSLGETIARVASHHYLSLGFPIEPWPWVG